MDYLTWNDRLAPRFFNRENEYRRVYLFATKALIADVGLECEHPIRDFIAAVKNGPSWTSPGNVCSKAEETCAGWRGRSRALPPYIGYLCLFSLAAGIESAAAAHAYY